MKIKTAEQARAALADRDRFMMLTHLEAGNHFTLDSGATVPKAVAKQLQGDLFVKPSDDGLLPGCSQTFRIVDG